MTETGRSWRELVSIAVVGTERRGGLSAIAADVAAVVDGQVPTSTAEEQVLAAAGVLGAWRRTGAVLTSATGPPPGPAPEDGRPAASTRAVQVLELLLDDHAGIGSAATALVAEWLTRCASSGRRLPAATVPRVLHAATSTRALRAPAVATGGPMVGWLAARNPTWAWASVTAAPADLEGVWADGTREQRRAALETLRASDPARGRSLLEETWASESAADRTRFVELLATGLSDDDEPFLEAALDDRSRTVRAAAAGLLATLPGSALAHRMVERLRPLISVTRERAGGSEPVDGDLTGAGERLAVEPPDDIDPSAARDGVMARGGPRGTGRRAWALVQITGATPLAFWEGELSGGPGEIVRLGSGSDELLAGWVLAATRQRDTAWARELLRYRQEPALLAVLPPEVAHAEVPAVLSRAGDDAVGPLLAATPAPWPAPTSLAIVARLRSVEQRQAILPALPVLATALDPSAASEVEAWIGSLRRDHPLLPRLRAVLQALSLRRAIARELA